MSVNKNELHPKTETPPWLEIVKSKVEGLRFGVVQIIVHDGKITQIERTEKTRLETPASASAVPRKSG
jgi:hypothetical protein